MESSLKSIDYFFNPERLENGGILLYEVALQESYNNFKKEKYSIVEYDKDGKLKGKKYLINGEIVEEIFYEYEIEKTIIKSVKINNSKDKDEKTKVEQFFRNGKLIQVSDFKDVDSLLPDRICYYTYDEQGRLHESHYDYRVIGKNESLKLKHVYDNENRLISVTSEDSFHGYKKIVSKEIVYKEKIETITNRYFDYKDQIITNKTVKLKDNLGRILKFIEYDTDHFVTETYLFYYNSENFIEKIDCFNGENELDCVFTVDYKYNQD